MNLKELAHRLELSPTTVSRALNGYPEVSEATRARVRRAADELHYRPRHTARQLATGHSLVLGHVIAQSHHALLGPLFADLMAGAGEAAGALGYDMHMRIVPDADEEACYRDAAASRRLDGVLVHGPLVVDSRIALLHELRLPFVVHGRSEVDVPYRWLDVDNADAMHRATALLLDLGHERIAFLNGPQTLHYAARRLDGFVAAHRERGVSPDAALMREGVLAEDYGHDAASALLAGDAPPTALVCAGLLPAWGVLRALYTRHLEPGRDVSLVAYDDGVSWLPNRPGPGGAPLLTTLRSSIREAGRRLVHRLVDAVEHPDGPVTPDQLGELMGTDLVIGRSTGPPPVAAARRAG